MINVNITTPDANKVILGWEFSIRDGSYMERLDYVSELYASQDLAWNYLLTFLAIHEDGKSWCIKETSDYAIYPCYERRVHTEYAELNK